MKEEQPIEIVARDALLERVKALAADGWRLVQISCVPGEPRLVDYSFDKDYRFLGLRIELGPAEDTLPSVSAIYLAAFVYENELHDLFGLNIEGIAVDYKGHFYRLKGKPEWHPAAAPKPATAETPKPVANPDAAAGEAS